MGSVSSQLVRVLGAFPHKVSRLSREVLYFVSSHTLSVVGLVPKIPFAASCIASIVCSVVARGGIFYLSLIILQKSRCSSFTSV